MPRKAVDPIIAVLGYFETAPLDGAKLALSIAKETIRRRTSGETVLTANGPKIDPPQSKRKRKTEPIPQSTNLPDEPKQD